MWKFLLYSSEMVGNSYIPCVLLDNWVNFVWKEILHDLPADQKNSGQVQKDKCHFSGSCLVTVGNRENFLQMNLSSNLLLQCAKSFLSIPKVTVQGSMIEIHIEYNSFRGSNWLVWSNVPSIASAHLIVLFMLDLVYRGLLSIYDDFFGQSLSNVCGLKQTVMSILQTFIPQLNNV